MNGVVFVDGKTMVYKETIQTILEQIAIGL